jgi:non-heme chloroperoxidase
VAGSTRGRGRGHRRLLLGLGLAAGAAGAAALLRSRPTWATGEDPCGPEGLTLPAGERLTVATDDGASLDVLLAGPADGPLVVLAHGWTNTKAMWAPVARLLVASGHRVVLYDQRGHGASTLGSEPMRMERLGEDLRTVLIAVGANEVVLAGHSMGGMTIQALATTHPDLVERYVQGIVLVATAASLGLPRPLPAAAVELVLGETASARLARLGQRIVWGALGPEIHRPHAEALHREFLATSGAARAGFLVGMTRMDFRKGLASIVVPTTILVGSHDRLTPPRLARALADGIPGAHLEVVDGAGHMLGIEVPARVADAIAQRAAALPTAPAAG